jgi:hypothetical protein
MISRLIRRYQTRATLRERIAHCNGVLTIAQASNVRLAKRCFALKAENAAMQKKLDRAINMLTKAMLQDG